MHISEILINCLWSGLFSCGLGIILTSPFKYILPAFFCGFLGRLSRDLLMSIGLGQSWSTAIAATVVVLAAFATIKRHEVSPVVLITGVLPLAASAAVFNVILELMKVSNLTGDALNASSIALVSNSGKAFNITLAIALGLAAGITCLKLFKREKEDGN